MLTSLPGRFSTLHPSCQYSSICASVSADPRASFPCALQAAAIGAVADYRAEALELMKANVATTMDYARQLMAARTSAEFVELSSTHARKQCELMLQQTRALRALARTVTKSGAD